VLFWLCCSCLAVAALGALAVRLPVRLQLRAEGRGDPSGAWALAGGIRLGPLSLSALAARGVPASLQLHLLSQRIYRRELDQLLPPRPARPPGFGLPALRAGWHRLDRWLDPPALAAFLLGEHKHVTIAALRIELDYSFADIAFTGKLYGALCALSGLLPPPVVLRQRPRWDTIDRGAAAVAGELRVWPGRLLVDTACYLIKHLKWRRPRLPAAVATRELATGQTHQDRTKGHGH
jgi:hypothetical protein